MPREQGRWCELQKVRGVRSFWNIGGHAIGLTHRVQTLPCNQQFVLGAGQGYVKNSAFFFDRIRISFGAIRGVGTGRYVGDIAHGTFGSFGRMHRDQRNDVLVFTMRGITACHRVQDVVRHEFAYGGVGRRQLRKQRDVFFSFIPFFVRVTVFQYGS